MTANPTHHSASWFLQRVISYGKPTPFLSSRTTSKIHREFSHVCLEIPAKKPDMGRSDANCSSWLAWFNDLVWCSLSELERERMPECFRKRCSPKPQACRTSHLNYFERLSCGQAKGLSQLTICILLWTRKGWYSDFRIYARHTCEKFHKIANQWNI